MAAPAFRVQRFIGANDLGLIGDVGGDASAPAVILLHGGGQTRHSWGAAMRKLVARGYFVINLDARGHGESEWSPDGDYSLDVLARDLECVIGTLSSRPALVGASMGGATCLFLIGTRSEPIASALVLVDVVPMINAQGAEKILAFMRKHPHGFATVNEAADAVGAYNPHRERPTDVSGLKKNLRRRADGRFYWHWDPRVIAGQDASEPPFRPNELNDAADRVRVPTLLVRGMKSDIVTDEGVADLKSRIPSLEIFDVAEAGHMVAGDKNDAFNQGVFGFLNRHCAGALSREGRA